MMLLQDERRRNRRRGQDDQGRGLAVASVADLAGKQDLLEQAVRQSRLLLLVLDETGKVLLAEGGGIEGLDFDPAAVTGRSGLDCLATDSVFTDAVHPPLAGDVAHATL